MILTSWKFWWDKNFGELKILASWNFWRVEIFGELKFLASWNFWQVEIFSKLRIKWKSFRKFLELRRHCKGDSGAGSKKYVCLRAIAEPPSKLYPETITVNSRYYATPLLCHPRYYATFGRSRQIPIQNWTKTPLLCHLTNKRSSQKIDFSTFY